MISVILSTYNRPSALAVVLRGYDEVVNPDDFEVVVADDGSDERTREVIDAHRRVARFALKHVWQEDRGFRLAAVRNRAVREAAAGDVLLFTDGDCVPFADSLVFHACKCRLGVATVGARCWLTEQETSIVLQRGSVDLGLFQRLARRSRRALATLWLKNQLYSRTRLKVRPKLTTANAAVWRQDFERVNGFDERFEGWGYEDEDIARRLRRVGVKVADGSRASRMLHLFHPVHVSHRPSARGSANYRLFKEGDYLVRPLRGLEPRSPQGVTFSLADDAPESLAKVAAMRPAEVPEVVVEFTRQRRHGAFRQRDQVVLCIDPDRVQSLDALYDCFAERFG